MFEETRIDSDGSSGTLVPFVDGARDVAQPSTAESDPLLLDVLDLAGRARRSDWSALSTSLTAGERAYVSTLLFVGDAALLEKVRRNFALAREIKARLNHMSPGSSVRPA